MAQLFDSVYPTDEARRAALAWSKCDLFFNDFRAWSLLRSVQACDAYAGQLFVHASALHVIFIVA